MERRMYTLRELRQVIQEEKAKDEFKPVIGKGVEEEEKKNNKETYSAASKLAKDAAKGVKETPEEANYPEYTRGMETLLPKNISPDHLKNIQAQVEGYFSYNDKKAHSGETRGNADYSKGKAIFNGMKERANAEKKSKDDAAGLGITGHDTGADKNARHTMFKEEKIPTLKFKRLKFICESHMMSKIPDSYKVEGKKFNMKDAYNNEYLVEWHVDDDVKVLNKTQINEQQDRIKQLFGYKYCESNTTGKGRLAENDMSKFINKAREISSIENNNKSK